MFALATIFQLAWSALKVKLLENGVGRMLLLKGRSRGNVLSVTSVPSILSSLTCLRNRRTGPVNWENLGNDGVTDAEFGAFQTTCEELLWNILRYIRKRAKGAHIVLSKCQSPISFSYMLWTLPFPKIVRHKMLYRTRIVWWPLIAICQLLAWWYPMFVAQTYCRIEMFYHPSL